VPYSFGSATPSTGGLTFSAPSGGYTFGAHATGGKGMAPGLGEKVGGFLLSTVESFPELFGIEPSEMTQVYRAQNPVGSFVSQAAGAFVPYMGAAKLTRAVPLLRAGIGAVEGLGSTSLTRGALGAMAETAIVEAGRLGISATPLPEMLYQGATGREPEVKSLGTQAGEAVFNVVGAGALGGVLGGLGGRFAAGRKISDFTRVAPDEPIPHQIRALDDLLTQHADPAVDFTLPPEAVDRLTSERNQLIKYNLEDVMPVYADNGETSPGPFKYDNGAKAYHPIVGDNAKGTLTKYLNRVNAGWKGTSADKLTQVRRLVADPHKLGVYRNADDLAGDLAAAGVDLETVGVYAQDAKTIEVKAGVKGKAKPAAPTLDDALGDDAVPDFAGSSTPKQDMGQRLLSSEAEWTKTTDPALGRAKGLQKRFTSKVFKDVGDGWRQGFDETGFSIMVKKVKGGADPGVGDRWMMLRTDRPDKFAQKSAMIEDLLDRSGYFPKTGELAPVGEPLYDAAAATMRLTENPVSQLVRGAKTKAGAMIRDVGDSIRNIAQPTTFLLARNIKANQGLSVLKELELTAEARVTNLMLGKQMIDPKARAGGSLSLGKKATAGFQKNIDEMAQRDLDDVQLVLQEEKPIEFWRGLNKQRDINGDPIISDKALEFVEALNFVDQGFQKRVKTLTETLRTDPAINLLNSFKARAGHFGITRDYPGAYKIYLRGKEGDIEGIASGKDWADAEEIAKRTIEHWGKRGKQLTMGGRIDEATRTAEDLQRMRARLSKPGFIKARTGMVGYEISRGPIDKKALSELVSSNLRRRENYLRDAVAADVIAPLHMDLKRTSPKDADALESVRQRMAGEEGAFAKAQNAMADKALAAIGLTGKDSATEIVKATQRVLSNFQFNFVNLAQPITNMTGIFQTLLPQVAYLMRASPETLARNYASLPMLDGVGNLKGSLGVLSEVKLLKNSFARLGKRLGDQEQDYQEFVELLTHQRVVAPRFVEANIGTDGGILRDPLSAFKSTKHFVDLLEASNTLLVSKSEELSRMVTVNAAYEMGKIMGLDAQRMAIFARDLVARTNYNYGSMDRAKMATTPVGSLFGTFKNWMFHYMSSMAQFAAAGREGLVPLMWQTAATGVIGGAVSTPLVMPIADAFSQFFTGDKFATKLHQMTGGEGMDDRVADGLMYGLPALMGVSLAAQTSSPGADPARDASMIFSFAAFDRMKNLSTGVKDALAVAQQTGESPWEDSNVRNELVRALAPRTIYRAMSLGTDMAVTSLSTGYDVTKPMGLGGALLYGLGFNPVDLEKTYEVYNEIRDDQQKEKDLVKEMGQTMAQAWADGDDRLANRVYARASGVGVDMSKVLRSAQSRTTRGEETQLEFTASDEDREKFAYAFPDEEQ
jgi:hypothetical protein